MIYLVFLKWVKLLQKSLNILWWSVNDANIESLSIHRELFHQNAMKRTSFSIISKSAVWSSGSHILIVVHINILHAITSVLILEINLTFNDLEKLVCHLKEYRSRTFLKIKVQNVNFSWSLRNSWVRSLRSRKHIGPRWVLILRSWRSSLFWLRVWRVASLHLFINVNIKLEELLSNEIFNKFVIID